MSDPLRTPLPPELGNDDPPLSDEELLALEGYRESQARPDAAPVDPPARVQAYEIFDDAGAEWCMRWLAKIVADDQADEDQALVWRGDVDRWLQTRLGQRAGRRGFFEHQLTEYALRRRAAAEAAGERLPATLALPSGDVKTTGSKPAVVVEEDCDKDVASWLEDHLPAEQLEPVDGEQLIKWAAKVYLRPLRRLVEISEARIRMDRCTCGSTIFRLADVADAAWLHLDGYMAACDPADDASASATPVPVDEDDPADDVIMTMRFACPTVDPSTGEAWSDDVPLWDRHVPGLTVTEPSVSVSVKPKGARSKAAR